MKSKIYIILGIVILIIVSVNFYHQKQSIKILENNYNQQDDLGHVVSVIQFEVKATKEELEVFTDGIVPWISVAYPHKKIEKLIDGDKIVLPFKKVTLIIDYPLKKAAAFELTTAEKGFSKKQLIALISEKYHQIYKEEEQSMKQSKPTQENIQLSGKYGIWGHDLSDLDLSSIEIHKGPTGQIYLTLGVES